MENRNLLHRSKIHQFKAWLILWGYEPEKNDKNRQVLRWKVKGSHMPIIFDGKSSEHFLCNDAAVPFVKNFINTEYDSETVEIKKATVKDLQNFLTALIDGKMSYNSYKEIAEDLLELVENKE
jgi:glutaredoxin-related protein